MEAVMRCFRPCLHGKAAAGARMDWKEVSADGTDQRDNQGVLDQISEGFAQKGAYNLRQNGVSICHGDSEHIKIRKKEDKPGIDILIDGDTKGERVLFRWWSVFPA